MTIPSTFRYKGFEIPLELLTRTGANPDNFEIFGRLHLEELERWTPIEPDHRILELGCGIGREALLLTEVLSSRGSYHGVDLDLPSIRWCEQTITPLFPNFRFHHANVRSAQYNPRAFRQAESYEFPVADGSMDRVFAQSLFTHLLPEAAARYLAQTRRALAPGGLALFTFFAGTENEFVGSAASEVSFFRISLPHAPGCFVLDRNVPEASVGYTHELLADLVRDAGLVFEQPVLPGCWLSSRNLAVENGQDLIILRRA